MAETNRVELVIIEGGRGDGGGAPPPPPDGDQEAVFGSHIALAGALVGELGADWRCAAGQWYHWDGQRWERDQTKLIWDRSRAVCRRIGAGAPSAGLARTIQSAPSVYAAVQIAAADRRIACAMSVFDRDPWILNTPEGILNLRTGQMGPHDRAALMTRIAGASPRGDCPTFARYLHDVTGGDEALQHYLQRVAGYCLTGSIEEHCILFFHGPGGSGKTTFLLVIQDMLGDYAVNAPMHVFTVSSGERHPTELAHFRGARVVTASEIEEGMRWDEAKLKAISGGDKITARYMRGDFFSYEPQCKLLLAGNHRPRLRSADDAMRRRLQVIPFRRKPASVDKHLRDKLRSELSGILMWAVAGELARRRLGGLMPPRAVQAATDEYFHDENTLGRWLDERCECGPNHWSETRALYRDYTDWARRVGEYVLSERSFAQKLEQIAGLERAQHSRTRRGGFRGVRLLETCDLFETGPPAPGGARGPAQAWPRE
jgi:putative DNA primase/helicase